MKKLTYFLLFLFCFAAITVFSPIPAQAANTTRTLQPGRTYTFTGRDARVISHITVSGTGRYQFVTINERGETVSFGFTSGRTSVRGTGATLITPLASLNVTYDTSRLTLQETEGNALREMQLSAGQTLAVQNRQRTSAHIRTNQHAPFDAVVENASGGVVFIEREIRFPQLSIPAGGEAIITAHDSLTVYFPAMWYGENLRIRRLTTPAIFIFDLREGDAFTLTNSDENSVSIQAETFTALEFAYDYINRNAMGLAVNHGETMGGRITVQPRHSLTITPHMDAELVFPYALLDILQIELGMGAPAYHVLEAGQTMSIANNDPLRAYTVHLQNEEAGYPIAYDFTLEAEERITFAINVANEGTTINIPAGGVLTLTAGEPPAWAPQVMTVRFPDNGFISYRAAAPPIVWYTPANGTSLVFHNESDDDFTLQTRLHETRINTPPAFDYARTDADGEIDAFGKQTAGTAITLAAGERIHITNTITDYTFELYFPAAWLEMGLTAETTSEPALFRRLLEAGDAPEYGESLIFHNKSEMTISLETRLPEARANIRAMLDYVRHHADGEIDTFGRWAAGTAITLAAGERIHITNADKDNAIELHFPAAWLEMGLTAETTGEPALYRRLLEAGDAPEYGESLIFHNKSEMTISLETRLPEARANARAMLDYVRHDADGEIDTFGRWAAGTAITLAAGERIHITNADKNNAIELHFPAAWLEAGLAAETTNEPALSRHLLETGEYMRFDNVNAHYNTVLLLESDERNARFDYVLTDNRNVILDYGIRAMGLMNLRFSGRLTIMPLGNDAMYVFYPAEWQDSIVRVADADAPPLHHITLRPGDQIVLRSSSSSPITLSNNSAPGGAGYFIHAGDHTRNPIAISATAQAEHGNIVIQPNTTITLVAARGEDLHIWMPVARARQLRLI